MTWNAAPRPGGSYFVYGLALDPAVRAAAKVQLGEGRQASLPGQQLVFRANSPRWNGRVAGLERGTETVPGLLFTVEPSQWPAIEALEAGGAATPVKVLVDGQQVEATAFVPVPKAADEQQPVSEPYLAALLTAMKAAGLPEAWWSRLEAEALVLERVQRFGREHHLTGGSR